MMNFELNKYLHRTKKMNNIFNYDDENHHVIRICGCPKCYNSKCPPVYYSSNKKEYVLYKQIIGKQLNYKLIDSHNIHEHNIYDIGYKPNITNIPCNIPCNPF